VKDDYLLINYDADNLVTKWSDYHHSSSFTPIIPNGDFLPVVYSKEKIAVHVCNLKFDDILTVTTSPLGVPEGGADIRGANLTTTILSVSNSLDTLQSAGGTGTALQVGGLGFAAPGGLTSTTISGISPSSAVVADSTGKINFTEAGVTASPEQIADMMFALLQNARSLDHSITQVWNGHPHDRKETDPLPGSVSQLKSRTSALLTKVNADSSSQSNMALFDSDITDAQNLASALSSLSTALAAQSFGARAVTLQNNYATLRGILDIARQGRDQTPTPLCSATEIKKAKPHCDSKDAIAATAARHQFDLDNKARLGAFYDNYQRHLGHLCDLWTEEQVQYQRSDSTCERDREGYIFDVIFGDITMLRDDLQGIDTDAGKLFQKINDWNDQSTVEQTDLVNPVAGNALLRLSIVIQHGYTPFTVSAPVAAIGTPAAVTAPTAAAAAASPTTSTPAHAVKTILIEVHRRAPFNLAGGVVLIHVPTATYAVQQAPALATAPVPPATYATGTCNNVTAPIAGSTALTTAYDCISKTQKTSWQVAAMVGITYYPWHHGRDYFPIGDGIRFDWHPSLLLASSVTSLGSGIGALNFEPITGIDVFAGIGSAHTATLPNGIGPNSVLPSGYSLSPGTSVRPGFATGIAFDLTVFTSLFTKPSGTTLP
jgi:hypothetical protein